MPLSIPTRKSLVQSLRAYLLSAVPEWDTSTERRSFLGGLVKSLGSAMHDWYVALKRYAETEPFPQTAQGQFLTQGWWTDITKLSPLPAAGARGSIVVTGDVNAVLPAGTVISANALDYTVDHAVSIVTQSVAAASLTAAGNQATFNTAAPHMLATGMPVTISGAIEPAYNGDVEIIVISPTSFTYPIVSAATPPSPAATSGVIQATANFAVPEVTCRTTGPSGNLDGGATMSVGSAPAGVDETAFVTFGGIAGGADVESIEAYRQRVLFALGTDFGAFTGNEIEIVAKQIPGVTRVWVRKAQLVPEPGWPLEGQVFIAFMRDDEVNPFPTAQDVADVKNAIMTNCMTVNTAPEDVVVSSPLAQTVNFNFQSITPDSPSMRAAIRASLAQFFREGVDYGVDIPEDDYRCAIRDTYDPQTRSRLKSFVLLSPIGDIDVNEYALPIMGSVFATRVDVRVVLSGIGAQGFVGSMTTNV